MSSGDVKLTDDESLKKSKKRQKKEDAWRPEGPRDPFALVCIFVLRVNAECTLRLFDITVLVFVAHIEQEEICVAVVLLNLP